MPTLWEKIISLKSFQKKNNQPARATLLALLAGLPEVPGVYFFLDATKQLLYIGKATSLKDRVKSYFLGTLLETRGPKVAQMQGKIAYIAYRSTDSVLEALIWEAKLIKAHQPPVNSDEKDDKSYNYVIITREAFPRVLVVRGRDIHMGKFTAPVKYSFGPFLAGGALREGMKIIRKLFPYRDKCIPLAELSDEQKKRQRECFSAQINLCPGVCMGKVSRGQYNETINHIRLFFEGHKKLLLKQLKMEMKLAAKELRFERAAEIKRTLFGLEHIRDIALIKDDVQEILSHRVEAYDVAHFSGKSSVGVRVVIENNLPAKAEYRMFILRGGHRGNDLTALEEILVRRLRHIEWPLPEIMVIDGGENHYHVAEKVLALHGLTIPLVAVVKNIRHQASRYIGAEGIIRRFKKEILLANSEAHRFAITFHRVRRGKEFLR